MKEFPYESSFANIVVKPLVSFERDRCLALASLVEVKNFIPEIDTKVNLDVLPIAFNACVINRVNKNRDVVDTATAVGMYKHFLNKPINVEHNRQKVIGTILTAGFSEFGSDRPLSEEQVKGMTTPFNVTLGGIIWRVVAPELADHLEECADPTSEHYLSVAASWELGFTGYNVVLLEGGCKDLSQAKKIITDPDEVEKVRDQLTACGGKGKIEDLFAYRMPFNDVLPLGIGLTEKPAAEVKGVAVKQADEVGIEQKPAFDPGAKKTPTPKAVTPPNPGVTNQVGIVTPPASETMKAEAVQENQNKISQTGKTTVNTERHIVMKIASLKDLTDETLKECSASAVSDFIATELKKGSDVWEAEKNKLNTQLAQAQEASTKLQTDHAKLQEQMKQVQATVDALNAEKAEREKVEKFNVRMASVNEAYELDDEVRAALVEEIKAIASDEDFAKWQKKASVLLKGFAKKAPPFKKDGDKDKDDDCKGKKAKAGDDDVAESKKAKAADDAQATVDKAVDNGEKDKGGLPNSTTAAQPTLKEKYQAAFARENFEIRV